MDKQYSNESIVSLFNEMAASYGLVHLWSSLGFALIWRKHVVRECEIQDGHVVADFMSGRGEIASLLKNSTIHMSLIDVSPRMIELSRHLLGPKFDKVDFKLEDAVSTSFLDHSLDRITCAFGIKTLDTAKRIHLLDEFDRILADDGRVSLLEFALPPNRLVRFFFKCYVKYYVPFLGRIFAGNPENYRMLWWYTEQFSVHGNFAELMRDKRFNTKVMAYFFGSAVHYVFTRSRSAG